MIRHQSASVSGGGVMIRHQSASVSDWSRENDWTSEF